MKKSQRDQITSMDDFEDLTLFANESFDTQDVDLFEFTSEESSPLTRLKSIILSLDWEINDEILQELADELDNLQAMWQGDKVAEVYLQGLHKIGSYIRTKGAYAHPNSIKLLLTFFYNFEKIISSDKITGEQITQLLKGDVRKFKILQYQINQSEIVPGSDAPQQAEVPIAVAADTAETLDIHSIKQLKAAILSLDWEVTDESLRQFNKSIVGLHQFIAENKPALVLVQGLQAMGDYIAEERAEAHPESFILLHSFSENLEKILQSGESALDRAAIQDILVDQINRLNNLKMLITSQASTPVDERRIEEVVDELSGFGGEEPGIALTPSPEPSQTAAKTPLPEREFLATAAETPAVSTAGLEAEIDTLFAMDAMPAMESADVQYPDEILPPDAIQPVDDELADDFIESQLSTKRGFAPALADADETSGFNENAEPFDLPTQSDLAEQLDFLFSDEASTTPLTLSDTNEFEPVSTAGDEPIIALADIDFGDTSEGIEAALSDTYDGEEQSAFASESASPSTDFDTLDIQSKLDSFFTDIEEEPAEPPAVSVNEIEHIEQTLFFDNNEHVPAALAESEEERGFSEEAEIAALQFSPMDEIEEKLDFFFGSDADGEPDLEKAFPGQSTGGTLDETLEIDFSALELPTDEVVPKPLFDERIEPVAAGVAADQGLEEALDHFFDDTREDTPAAPATTVDALTKALETTIDGHAQVAASGSVDVQLAALGALLPALVRTPTREQMAEFADRLATLKQAELSGAQKPLAQLLESVITLLAKLPSHHDAATEKLINYLYEQLIAVDSHAAMLPEAINRFTEWLLQVSAVMPVMPALSDQSQETPFAYTAKELYFELAELRSHIRDEFAKLRHEMHHHR